MSEEMSTIKQSTAKPWTYFMGYTAWVHYSEEMSVTPITYYIPGSMRSANSFYPRPVLAFGYCHRPCLCIWQCVCVCVCINPLRESIPRLFNEGTTTMTTRCAPACSHALPVKPQGVWARGSEAWARSRDLRIWSLGGGCLQGPPA